MRFDVTLSSIYFEKVKDQIPFVQTICRHWRCCELSALAAFIHLAFVQTLQYFALQQLQDAAV